MHSNDAEKSALKTPMGNFHYTIMSFGLKNVGATYQWTITFVFHDMLRNCLEDCVDDIVAKSKEVHKPCKWSKEIL